MNTSLATPPPSGQLRRFRAWAWDNPDMRSTTIGVLGVIIYFLLVAFFGPRLFNIDSKAVASTRPSAAARKFNIRLAPETPAETQVAPPKPPEVPNKFVEINPDAPENVPDKTNNFGAQNQQVAQEKPTPDGKSDRPATEGKKDFETTAIVTGQLSKPVEQIEAVPDPTPPQPAVRPPMLARPEQTPLLGFEKKEGDNKDGIGSNISDLLAKTQPAQERITGAPDTPNSQNMTMVQPAIDPTKPRPRQTLATNQTRVRPTPLADNPVGTKNVGIAAYDAKWSNYGTYLQKLIETVQIQWERVIESMGIHPPVGSTVTVKFILDSHGWVSRIVDVDNKSSESAKIACVRGITDRAPYGDWTDDMKKVLGEEQELTFSFLYQ